MGRTLIAQNATTTGSYFDDKGPLFHIPGGRVINDLFINTLLVIYGFINGVYKPDGENKLAMEAAETKIIYTNNRIKEYRLYQIRHLQPDSTE